MIVGVIFYSTILRMSNCRVKLLPQRWHLNALQNQKVWSLSSSLAHFTGPWDFLQPAHRRWSENQWNFSGAHADLLITVKMAQHQVDITFPWMHYRKSCLHCCFQDNYINIHLFFFLLFLASLYRILLYFIHLFLWVFHMLSFVLVGFISVSLKQCRNWLVTGNSFQDNIAP